jgi:hypothetical protein
MTPRVASKKDNQWIEQVHLMLSQIRLLSSVTGGAETGAAGEQPVEE